MLQAAPGRVMAIGKGLFQFKVLPERAAKRRRVVADHRQPAAALRPVRRKGPDNDMAAWDERPHQTIHIGAAVLRYGQKMKSGAVVPEIIMVRRFPARHVGSDPLHLRRARSKP